MSSFKSAASWALAAAALALAGCASERLAAEAPAGVNLTGNWKLNLNLSDDPDKLLELQKSQKRTPQPGSHRDRGGLGNPGGMGVPPIGTPQGSGWSSGSGEHFANASAGQTAASTALATPGAREAALSGDWTALPPGVRAPGIEQSSPLPPVSTGAAGASAPGPGTPLARLLQAPEVMLISQQGPKITIRTKMQDGTLTADEFTAGTEGPVTDSRDNTIERKAGWRGPVFVVTTKAKNGAREDDYALDEDGRLIMTSDIRVHRFHEVVIKRVYDRVKP